MDLDHQLFDELNQNKEVIIEDLKSIPLGSGNTEHLDGCFMEVESRKKKREWNKLSSNKRKREWNKLSSNKRKREWNTLSSNKRMKFYIEDPLQVIISRLDMKSLFKSRAVCKSWNSFIRSPGFVWKPTSTEVCLLSHASPENGAPPKTVMSSPSTGLSLILSLSLSSSFKHFDLVASSRGLVCVRAADTHWSKYQLAVGNPLTKEWVDLPILFAGCVLSCTMEVLDCGAFRVGIFVPEMGYNAYYVYDSVTNRWSVTRLHFRPGEATKYMFYNLVNKCWETDLLKGMRITTGLEVEGEEHAIPYSFLGYNPCLWRYNNQLYVASPWYRKGREMDRFDGFGVWRVDRDKKELILVDATLVSRFADRFADEALASSRHIYFVYSSAEDNLVCFHELMLPAIVYDMSTAAWTCHGSKLLHYVCGEPRSLVYSPSLCSPHQGQA